MYQDMSIYSPPGTKVKYHSSDKKALFSYANLHLEDGKTYTVSFTVVNGFRTDVYLVEVPGRSFNSVLFEEISE